MEQIILHYILTYYFIKDIHIVFVKERPIGKGTAAGKELSVGILKKGKEIIKIMQKADNFDLYREILDLNADLQNLARENVELKQKNEELTKQLTLKQKRKFKESSHLMDDDEISYIPRFLGG